MATQEQSITIGLFQDRASAEQAVNDLERTGFTHDQISFSGHGAGSGGLLSELKGLFSGDESAREVYDDLVGMGLSHEDAQYYQQEYETGQSVVSVMGDSRMQEASAILARHGGHGASRRSAQTADSSSAAQEAHQGDIPVETDRPKL